MDVEGEHLTVRRGVAAIGTGHHETAYPAIGLSYAPNLTVPGCPAQNLRPPLGPILGTQGVQVVVRHRAPIRRLPCGDMNLTEFRHILATRRTHN